MSGHSHEQASSSPQPLSPADVAQIARERLDRRYERIFQTEVFQDELRRAQSSEPYMLQLYGNDEGEDGLEFKVYRRLEREFFRVLTANNSPASRVALAMQFYSLPDGTREGEAAKHAHRFRSDMEQLTIAAEADRFELATLPQDSVEAAREAWEQEIWRITQLPAYLAILQSENKLRVARGNGRISPEEDLAIFMIMDARKIEGRNKGQLEPQALSEGDRRELARFLGLNVESSWFVLRAIFRKYERYVKIVDHAASRHKTIAESLASDGKDGPRAPFSK